MHTIPIDRSFANKSPNYPISEVVPDATVLAGEALVGTAWLSQPTKGLIGTSNWPMGTYEPMHSDTKRKEARRCTTATYPRRRPNHAATRPFQRPRALTEG
jgi:hypothetical protein